MYYVTLNRFDNLKQVCSVAHPNFALIKYWGKSNLAKNTPAMDSISITIDTFKSVTKVSFDSSITKDIFILNGIQQRTLGQIKPTVNYLRTFHKNLDHCIIQSDNNFPTAAGLASSASGVASLVTALSRLFNLKLSNMELMNAAMLGSGSAPRSMFPGFVYLDKDNFTCKTILDEKQWPLKIIICLTNTNEKVISSRIGMQISKATSPFYRSWINSQDEDIKKGLQAIKEKDFHALAEVSESNCEKMHKVMESSEPPLLYKNEVTKQCIKQINQMKMSGLSLFYTVDAGKQVKIICKPDDTETIVAKMKLVPNVHSIIEANLGQGARIINES